MKASAMVFSIYLRAPMDRSICPMEVVLEAWLAGCYLDCLLLLTVAEVLRLDYRLDSLLLGGLCSS